MKKKLISTLLCVSMVATMLVGCGGDSSSSTDSTSDTTEETTDDASEETTDDASDDSSASAEGGKVYYLNFKPEVEDQWQEIAAAYTAETGVEVKVVTAASGEYETTLKSEIVKSDAPTLFQINGPVGYQSWKDYCLDLSDTDVYDALSDKSLAVTDGDGVYGIPYTIEGYGIIYNQAIMDKYFALDGAKVASMDEINNFEKLKEVVEDMTAKKDELGIEGVFASTSLLPGEDWRWQTHLLSYPIHYEFADAGVDDLDEITFSYAENFKNIFDLYINNSCVSPALLGNKSVTDSMAEFALGQAAMVQNGNWAWSQISETEGNIVEEENVKFLPIYMGVDGEENNGLAIGTENFWAINSQASEADIQATKDFISWLITSDAGKDYMVNSLGNTAPFTTFADDEKPQDPLAVSMLSSMESGKTAVPWAFTAFPSEQYKTDVGDALLQYSGGSMSWDDVVDTVVTRWSEEKAASATE